MLQGEAAENGFAAAAARAAAEAARAEAAAVADARSALEGRVQQLSAQLGASQVPWLLSPSWLRWRDFDRNVWWAFECSVREGSN